MPSQAQAYRLMPWAWSVAWLLTGAGTWLSDIYSSPSRSLVPFFALSAVGWGVAGVVTAGASGYGSKAVRLAAWAIAYLVAIVLGFVWLHAWSVGFFGLIAATGLGGAIGAAGSSRPGLRRLWAGVLSGLTFLLLAAISFYAGYFLLLFHQPLAAIVGGIGAGALASMLPGALCGLGAGLVMRRLLGIAVARPTGALT